jgi:hypothetical protein
MAGGRERQAQINELTAHVRDYVAQGLFDPGPNLVPRQASP